MKRLLVIAVLFVAFNTVKGQGEKVYLGKSKSEVMSALTLDDNIVKVISGSTTSDSTFYYSASPEGGYPIAYYFGDGYSCSKVVFYYDFKSYKKELKEFTRNSQNADSNVQAATIPTIFLLKDSQFLSYFYIDGDSYIVEWSTLDTTKGQYFFD